MKSRIFGGIGVAGLVLVGSSAAWAQTPGVRTNGTDTFMGPGLALELGGGVLESSPGRVRDATNPGGYWDVRAVLGARTPIGLELAYVGASQDLSQPGSDARLYRNGAEADLRFNIAVLKTARHYLAPFGFAGAGWQHISTSGVNLVGGLTTPVSSGDDVLTVPVGGGISYSTGPLLVDARFTYRPAFLEARSSLDTWSVGGQIGVAF